MTENTINAAVENMENKDILSYLQWYMDSGVDETISDETLDYFAVSPKAISLSSGRPGTPPDAATTKSSRLRPVEEIALRAQQVAESCNSLGELNEAIKNFDGCRLKTTATNTVFSDGNPHRGIMLIGDAPGVDEDRLGKPFALENGRLLDKMFGAIGLTRENDFYVTNILPWRPPGNRLPTPEEITICLPFIKRHIALIAPKILVLLGGTSVSSLLKTDIRITRLRGKWMDCTITDPPIPARPLLPPAYLTKQPKSKKDTWQDLLEIKRKIEDLSL